MKVTKMSPATGLPGSLRLGRPDAPLTIILKHYALTVAPRSSPSVEVPRQDRRLRLGSARRPGRRGRQQEVPVAHHPRVPRGVRFTRCFQ